MGESRTELLAWLNDLLQLGYTKIEHCGTGAAHCQIMDSIYRDVPLSKVKFNARHEYEYIQNFKVLQATFDKHKIENHIPVERLSKCKFQDNLEFLQWMKKFWDQYYPGGAYDAVARRKEGGGPTASRIAHKSASPAGMKKSISNSSVTGGLPKAARTAGPNRVSPGLTHGSAGAHSAAAAAHWEREKAELEAEYQKVIAEMTQQSMELKVNIEQVEKEREFYFGKLREIEIFVQQHLETGGITPEVEAVLKEVQQIMYRTEEGFEIPDAAVEGVLEEEMY
ncbi:hypothetical protein HK102_006435 [Quaeritorhiza haematococci]|nr:hypothetical protein HK102_006435 [Quaeritorhiza haematococci]